MRGKVNLPCGALSELSAVTVGWDPRLGGRACSSRVEERALGRGMRASRSGRGGATGWEGDQMLGAERRAHPEAASLSRTPGPRGITKLIPATSEIATTY